MNRSLNVFLGLSVCLVLFGGMWFVSRVNQENEGWRPSDMYSQVGSNNSIASSFSNATLSSSSNDGLAVSMRSRSFSSRVHAPAFSYAPVSGRLGVQSSAVGSASYSAQGGGLYTTSSAEVRSFGGGGNASAGSAGGFRASAQGSIAQAAGVSSSLSVGGASYTPVLSTSSSVSNDEMLAMAQASNVASASGYAGLGYTTATYGTASYGSSSPRGIGGRKNAAPGRDPYDVWLEWLRKNGQGYGENVGGVDGGGNIYNWDYEDAWNAFCDWFSMAYPGSSPDDYTGADATILWDQWLSWFMSNNGTHTDSDGNIYNFLPIGDYLPLLVMAVIYIGYIAIRRRNKTKTVNTLN